MKRKESHMKKLICLCLALIALMLPLASCSKEYADDVSVEKVSEAMVTSLTGTIPLYSLADEGYLDDYFTMPDYVTDHIIHFSTEGNNLDEFGVFHVTEGNAEDMQSKLETYLKDCYEQNKDWYDSYMPEETPKLRDAEVKVFGNYVVYAVFAEAEREAAFDAAEKALKN